jgi:hypothetical protein
MHTKSPSIPLCKKGGRYVAWIPLHWACPRGGGDTGQAYQAEMTGWEESDRKGLIKFRPIEKRICSLEFKFRLKKLSKS